MEPGMEDRQELLMQHLLKEGSLEVDVMAEKLGLSPSTIRRGLRDLERRGLLRRTHGGAVPVEALLYEPFRYDASFLQQERVRTEEKRRIGLAAASLVQPGQTIAISAGTTATHVARCLRHRSHITIVTNAVNIAMELSNCSGLTVLCTGGILSGSWFSLLGPAAIHTVEEFYYDWAFTGLDGLHAEHGLTSNHPDEAALNRAMIRQARQTAAVADHSKVGKLARAQVCPLAAVQRFITDNAIPQQTLQELAARGLQVQVV